MIIVKRLAVAIGIMLFGCVMYVYPQMSGLTSPDAFTLWQSIGSGIVGIGFIKATTAGLNTGKSAEEKRHEEILGRLDQINARISCLEKTVDSRRTFAELALLGLPEDGGSNGKTSHET